MCISLHIWQHVHQYPSLDKNSWSMTGSLIVRTVRHVQKPVSSYLCLLAWNFVFTVDCLSCGRICHSACLFPGPCVDWIYMSLCCHWTYFAGWKNNSAFPGKTSHHSAVLFFLVFKGMQHFCVNVCVYVCVCVCLCVRERECVCVCVCLP